MYPLYEEEEGGGGGWIPWLLEFLQCLLQDDVPNKDGADVTS